jgi:hypothetical protein
MSKQILIAAVAICLLIIVGLVKIDANKGQIKSAGKIGFKFQLIPSVEPMANAKEFNDSMSQNAPKWSRHVSMMLASDLLDSNRIEGACCTNLCNDESKLRNNMMEQTKIEGYNESLSKK